MGIIPFFPSLFPLDRSGLVPGRNETSGIDGVEHAIETRGESLDTLPDRLEVIGSEQCVGTILFPCPHTTDLCACRSRPEAFPTTRSALVRSHRRNVSSGEVSCGKPTTSSMARLNLPARLAKLFLMAGGSYFRSCVMPRTMPDFRAPGFWFGTTNGGEYT